MVHSLAKNIHDHRNGGAADWTMQPETSVSTVYTALMIRQLLWPDLHRCLITGRV